MWVMSGARSVAEQSVDFCQEMNRMIGGIADFGWIKGLRRLGDKGNKAQILDGLQDCAD